MGGVFLLGIRMMEEAVLCAWIHDYRLLIWSSSSAASILDFSSASSKLMMLLGLEQGSLLDGIVTAEGGMNGFVDDYCTS